MKKLIFTLTLILGTINSYAEELPILGKYKIIENLVGGCNGFAPTKHKHLEETLIIELTKKNSLRISRFIPGIGDGPRGFLVRRAENVTYFYSSKGIGNFVSKPNKVGMVLVSKSASFDYGRGLRVIQGYKHSGSKYGKKVADATFHLRGGELIADFKTTKDEKGYGTGRCIFEKIDY